MKTFKWLMVAVIVVLLCLGQSMFTEAEKAAQWFIDITDNCNDELSKNLLITIRQELHGKTYSINEEGDLYLLESSPDSGQNQDSDFPLHTFLILDDEILPKIGDGKIYMRFNPPNQKGLYNADFLLFVYRKDSTWERVLNPGNFRFKKKLSPMELQTRIGELIVGLTFK